MIYGSTAVNMRIDAAVAVVVVEFFPMPHVCVRFFRLDCQAIPFHSALLGSILLHSIVRLVYWLTGWLAVKCAMHPILWIYSIATQQRIFFFQESSAVKLLFREEKNELYPRENIYDVFRTNWYFYFLIFGSCQEDTHKKKKWKSKNCATKKHDIFIWKRKKNSEAIHEYKNTVSWE